MANNKKVNGITKNIQDLLNGLYKSTYYSNDDNKKLLNTTMDQIDGTIYTLLNKIENNTGKSNISSLYLRMQNSQKVKTDGSSDKFEKIFGDEVLMDGLLNTYSQNKYILDLDNEIDTICKHMTQLEEALDCIKDNILSSDNFNKDYLNIFDTSNMESEIFSSNMDELKNHYNIIEKIEFYLDDVLKYGEHFTYIVPYEKAFNKLLNNKSNIKIEQGKMIVENGPVAHIFNEDNISEFETNMLNNIKINVEFKDNIVNEAVIKMKMNNKVIPDNLELLADKDLYSDGLINKNDNQSLKELSGCYIRELKRANVIPLYIDDICLGYYHIEADSSILSSMNVDTKLNSLTLKKTNEIINREIVQRDNIIKTIASKLSIAIDKKFINANQDLKEEIYLILKYNMDNGDDSMNSLKVTYIPPEDMIHWYFKKDPVTHRGISALSRALFPAKLYTCLYITSVIGVLTRGQDKRVYYVKQNIDTNISETLLSTINQIKKSNFGLREINNLSNVLNITGKFNDYIIPVGQSGDAPIQFEIMPGQDIPIKTELMELLESMSVNSIGVPLDIIQNRRSADYALRLSMTSSKFQKHCMKLQLLLQNQISPYITKINNYHFNKHSILAVELPPPSYLSLQNTLSLLQNNVDYLNILASVMFSDEDPQELKLMFQRRYLKKKLNTHLDMDLLEEILKQSKLEFKQKSLEITEEDI